MLSVLGQSAGFGQNEGLYAKNLGSNHVEGSKVISKNLSGVGFLSMDSRHSSLLFVLSSSCHASTCPGFEIGHRKVMALGVSGSGSSRWKAPLLYFSEGMHWGWSSTWIVGMPGRSSAIISPVLTNPSELWRTRSGGKLAKCSLILSFNTAGSSALYISFAAPAQMAKSPFSIAFLQASPLRNVSMSPAVCTASKPNSTAILQWSLPGKNSVECPSCRM
mmetsp:Transcript_49799/g.100279  ORF Transcript_49799/g.100279 Transcript_49799/m.100279 type:complete len:219 (-) Transcript_49799:52-708(-)